MSTVITEPKPAARVTHKKDVIAGVAAIALVVVALVVGMITGARHYGTSLVSGAPTRFGEYPVLGDLLPRVSPVSLLAVLLAVAAVVWGPTLAQRLSWRRLLATGYLFAVAWIFVLALVDGWRLGVASRLASKGEYLAVVDEITDIPRFLSTFTSRILDFQPETWPTHVSAHPPGATLVFVWLDRLGLSGPSAAAVLCVLVGALAAVAVPITIATLGRPDLARAAVPFGALIPGAVWLGVSADALFAGVAAVGIALFAIGSTNRRPAAAALGGVLLGFGVFLNYGLVLMGFVALAVVLVTRNWRSLIPAVAGALAVVAAFTLAGFWWFEGYQLVVERYYQGIADDRPYWYWIWANLACLVLAVGPAAVAGLRRAAPEFLSIRTPNPVVALVRGAAIAVLAADISGMSKAEVERIWLPFAVWLVAAAALLPAASRRWWLAAQAGTALAVTHVLLTSW